MVKFKPKLNGTLTSHTPRPLPHTRLGIYIGCGTVNFIPWRNSEYLTWRDVVAPEVIFFSHLIRNTKMDGWRKYSKATKRVGTRFMEMIGQPAFRCGEVWLRGHM